MVKVSEIRINYQKNPTGIEQIGQIGWKILSDQKNVFQKGYELQIAEEARFENLIYSSGNVNSSESAHIEIAGIDEKLASLKKYYIRVRIDTTAGKSNWENGYFVTALIPPEKWNAAFITIESESDSKESRGSYLRKEFCINRKIKKAYACATALGLYQLYLNGRRIGEDEFTPRWTSYNKHLLYQVYDVTDDLKEGKNAAAAHIGAGWYKGDMGYSRIRNHYGTKTAFSGFFRIEYEDGSIEDICTDKTWKGEKSPVVFSEFYDGEIYDSNLEAAGWNDTLCEASDWSMIHTLSFNTDVLHAQSGCTVRKMEKLPVEKLIITPKGETVLDFGQELTGWVEFLIDGKPGDKAVLHFFEVLDRNGNVYRDNLRTAKQTVTYICNGKGNAVYHPNFTFQGFRYVHIAEFPCEVKKERFTACSIHSNMENTGYFSCSNEHLNQLHHNILWGMKDNFLDIPTDCPQRDERLGWTGDAQIFSRTASYLMDTYTFYSKWLKDLAEDQLPEGGVPHVIPDIVTGKSSEDPLMKDGEHSASAWADAAVIVPWVLYTMYGDKRIIRKQYNSMKAWIEFMKSNSKGNIWNYKVQMGDWVALDAEEGSYFGATPNDLTCTAFYAHSTELFSKMAAAIGEKQDAQDYSCLAEDIKQTYRKRFFDENGRLTVQTQTAQILTLEFGLAPEGYKENVVKDLLELLKKENGHLVTGFVGTPYFCHVLSENGCCKEAYELLLKEDFPSWLYQVKMGATTIWEHWDGIKPDGTMWSADMNSFNHYAYGAVGEWLYRVMCGIDFEEQYPGFEQFKIEPHIGGGLHFACAEYESIYGRIRSRWERSNNTVRLEAEIPCNTSATIRLTQARNIREKGGLEFQYEKGCYTARTGAGKYEIVFETD